MLSRIRASVDQRFNDGELKKRTYVIQYISAVIFISCGLLLPMKFLMLFCSEGIGQILLAYNNQKTLAGGNPKIIYFDNNRLGFFAGVAFSVTAVTRFIGLTPVYTGLFVVPYIATYFKFKRKDEIGFILVTGSAFGAAILTTISGEQIQFGYTQYAYALLLSIGVAFLKAWIAEILNIFIWLWLFGILFF